MTRAGVAQQVEAPPSNSGQWEFESPLRHETDCIRRQMARDLLRLTSMMGCNGRVLHESPENALMGVRSLLKTARKRHNRYWGRHG